MDDKELATENKAIRADRTALVVIDLQKGLMERESFPYTERR